MRETKAADDEDYLWGRVTVKRLKRLGGTWKDAFKGHIDKLFADYFAGIWEPPNPNIYGHVSGGVQTVLSGPAADGLQGSQVHRDSSAAMAAMYGGSRCSNMQASVAPNLEQMSASSRYYGNTGRQPPEILKYAASPRNH